MRLAASLVLYLAALVCARELETTTYPGSPQLDEDEEVTSTMEENSVEGYSITCYNRTRIPACDVIEEVTIIDAVASQTTSIEYDLTIIDGDELEESPRTMVCNLDSTKPVICTATEINESPSYTAVKTGSAGEEYDTATAETTSEISDLETTLSCSSSSLAVSTHAMSRTASGSVRSTSSVGPGVGSMSITNTQIRAPSISPTSSSHSTGAAPIATGEVVMMAGGAAMALLVAIL